MIRFDVKIWYRHDERPYTDCVEADSLTEAARVVSMGIEKNKPNLYPWMIQIWNPLEAPE